MTDTHSSQAWQRYRAVRVLAGHARDTGELVEVLGALGLTAAEGLHAPADLPVPPPRKPVRLDEASAGWVHEQLQDMCPAHHRRAC